MTIKDPILASTNKDRIASGGLLLQVRDLQIQTAGGINRVSDLSLQIQPRELIVMTGSGRLNKSFFLETLAGIKPPSKGDILLDGVDLYPNHKIFASYIGFVPPEIALHENLKVGEVLKYEGRLRLPRETSSRSLQQRVQEILEFTGLKAEESVFLRSLSNDKKWLASIAVELLNAPRLLLVSEPAVSLDPSDEIKITAILKQAAKNGMTIIQAANGTRSAMMADKVIVLAPDGSLAWFGPAAEAVEYIRDQLPIEWSVEENFSFDDVQTTVENQELAAVEPWSKRFRANSAYTKYIEDPLSDKQPDLLTQDRPLSRFRLAAKEKTPPPKVNSVSGLAKFSLLTNRAIRLLSRDRIGLLMLIAPPVIGLSDFFLSSPTMQDPLLGDPGRLPVVLGLIIFLIMTVTAILFHEEITAERSIYRREKRVTTLAAPYVLSKAWIAFLVAIYVSFVWAIIHFIAAGMINQLNYLPAYWITLALVAFTGGILGLIASAIARNSQTAILWALILTVPQLFLSGSILPMTRLDPVSQVLTFVNPSRYAFNTLLTFSGYGLDIATDTCWQLPEDQRQALTDAQKQSCKCMGNNIFSSCNFPGIHKFFTYVIEQPQPVAPTPVAGGNALPAQPQLTQGETLQQYANAVNDYAAQMQQYQNQLNSVSSSQQKYFSDLASWQRTRSLVIGNAEGVISVALAQYGDGFNVDPIQNWLVLLGMCVVLTVLLFAVQLRRGSLP